MICPSLFRQWETDPDVKKNQILIVIYQIEKLNLLVEMRILSVKKSDGRLNKSLTGENTNQAGADYGVI